MKKKIPKTCIKWSYYMFRREFIMASAMATVVVGQAWADEYGTANQGQVTIQQAASMMAYSAGNDQAQVSIVPHWSDELGWSVRAAAGKYLSDAVALGAIVEYGQDKEEYLANLGFELRDGLSLIGTVGNLAETKEFIDGEGDDKVSQMEYGLSLKGNHDTGILRGFEVNAFHTSAASNAFAIETGDLTGFQIATQLMPSETSGIRLAMGYERATWAGGDVNEGLTLQTLGSHKINDALTLDFEAKSAETENVYGLGFTYGLSSIEVQGSSLSVNLTKIEGKHGIDDDSRVALSWVVGFGVADGAGASNLTISSMGSKARPNMLADVVTRPAFLPKRVLAREDADACYRVTSGVYGFGDDILQGIRNEFGAQARFVDWNEIASKFAGSAEELDLFLDNAGLLDGMEAWVTRNGNELATSDGRSDARYQVFNSAGTNPSDWYYVLDNLQSYGLTLGRWFLEKRAFAYICN